MSRKFPVASEMLRTLSSVFKSLSTAVIDGSLNQPQKRFTQMCGNVRL